LSTISLKYGSLAICSTSSKFPSNAAWWRRVIPSFWISEKVAGVKFDKTDTISLTLPYSYNLNNFLAFKPPYRPNINYDYYGISLCWVLTLVETRFLKNEVTDFIFFIRLNY
jgi:hypothetical protein